MFYLCCAICTSDENEFNQLIDMINIEESVKDIIKEVSRTMNKDEEIVRHYVDWREEIQRTRDYVTDFVNERLQKKDAKSIEELRALYEDILEEEKEDARHEGYFDGVESGIEKKEKEMVINMYNKKIPIKTIADCANLSIDEVNKIIDSARI